MLTYTQYDGKTARVAVATSRDLVHWFKHGPAFSDCRYLNNWSKSGSIVSTLRNGKLVAAKINSKYWMYWGDGPVRLAYSENLTDWTVVEDSEGNPLIMLDKRRGKFDSDIAEAGPAAILTGDGILVSTMAGTAKMFVRATPKLDQAHIPQGRHCFQPRIQPGLLDGKRLETPYFKPETEFEKSGQYKQGTVFTEGLAYFRDEWFLYYGCADSSVGVAICRPVSKTSQLPKSTKAHSSRGMEYATIRK